MIVDGVGKFLKPARKTINSMFFFEIKVIVGVASKNGLEQPSSTDIDMTVTYEENAFFVFLLALSCVYR